MIDLIDLVRSIAAEAARAEENTNHPLPCTPGSPLLASVRQACVERGFTASGLAVSDDWKPISSAPRDGSNIIIRFGKDGVSQAKFIAGLPFPWQFIDTNDGVTWLINHAKDAPGGPSHWMHFPIFAATAAQSDTSGAARDVIAERRRQIEKEGYSHEHDDVYVNDEIASYAAFYVMPPAAREWPAEETGFGATWGEAIIPVDWSAAKPGDRRQELVKAGALVIAEIERFDRAATAAGKAAS